jgi:hypothetical protein
MKRIFTLSTTTIPVTHVRNLIASLVMSLIAFATQAQQATNVSFQAVAGAQTSISINWANGTGVGRIVVVKNATGTYRPTNNADITTLSASLNFTAGSNDQDPSIGGVAAVVFAGTGAGPITVTNLTSGNTYFVQVYEFTDATTSPDYILTTNANNPRGLVFYTSTGTFTTPVDVTSVAAQAWGAGAGGGQGASGNAGAGGGGGAFASGTATVAFGVNPTVTIGTGGSAGASGTPGSNGGASSFSTDVVAAGGSITNTAVGGTGGTVAASTGTVRNAGGNGGDGDDEAARGGGGGGSSGTAGGTGINGSSAADGTTGGAGGNGSDGDGGKGGDDGVVDNAGPGTFPGGGGGGRGDNGGTGGTGGGGLVIASFRDNAAPVASSINRLTPGTSPASGSTVTFRVTFNENVSNVDATDFAVTGPGTPVIGTVTANSPVQYDVQITGISGSGTVDLNFGSHNIVDISNNAFAGSITSEQTYTMDNAGPVLSLAVLQSPTTGTAKVNDVITFRITADAVGYVIGTSTINSQPFSGGFNDNGNNTYDLTYTVVNGHANWASGALPFSIKLNDALGNQSNTISAFTTANALAGDANAPSGYTVAIDQAFINNANKAAISFTFTGAEVGATYNYSFDDTDGGTAAITGTGTVAAAGETISPINLTSLIDGTITLTVYLTDLAGNNGSNATNNKIKDVVAPTGYSVAINQPFINNTNKTSVAFTFTGAQVGATYNYSFDDTDGGTTAVTGNGTVASAGEIISGIDLTSLTDGTITLTVYLTDPAGNQGSNSTDNKIKDVVAPAGYSVVINQSPITGANQAAVSFTFGAAVVGTTYNYSIDDANGGTAAVTGSGTVISATETISGINVTTLDDGTLTLTVTLADAAGNIGSNATDTETKDASPPTILISVPSATIARNANSRTYTVTYAGETTISLATGDISINATGGASATVASVTGAGSTRTVTLNNFTGNGSVGISIAAGTAADALGNTAAAAGPSATIIVDNTQPSVVLSSTDADGYVRSGQSNVTITATFTETNTPLTTPTISIPTASTPVSANMVATGNPLVWTYSWDTPTGNEGPITVTISTADAAGNTNTAATGQTAFTIDNQAPSAVTINQAGGQPEQDYVNPVNYTVVFTNGPIEASSFTAADFVVTGGTTTYTIGTISTSDNITWNVEVNVSAADGNFAGTVIPSLTATVTDLAGNVSGALSSTASDATVEFVIEPTGNGTISVSTPPTQNTVSIARAGGNGERVLLIAREGSAVNFVPVDGVDYESFSTGDVSGQDFYTSTVLDGDGNRLIEDTGGGGPYNITGLAGGTTYHFAVYHYHRGSADAYNNFRTASPATVSTTTTACSYPDAPTGLTSSSNTTEIVLGMTRTTDAEHFLILMRQDDGTPLTAPTNGANYTSIDNLNFTTSGALGNAKVVYSGEPNQNLSITRTITNLTLGTPYAFAIYTYNPTTFCYRTTALTGIRSTTSTFEAELFVTAGALSEPSSISSLGTALSGAVLPQTDATANFDFTITDDDGDGGATTAADGTPGRITQIVISQGANNQISTWTDAIASAQISDGTNSMTGTVNSNNITFSAIPNGVGQLGEVPNDGTKTYTLTVALRTALLSTLPTTIDGLQFDFRVLTAGFSVGTGSTFVAAQDQSSGAAKNVVDVVATQIVVASQPSTTALADVALVSQPIFHARDANNNRDLDIDNSLTVTTSNSTDLGHSSALANFTDGVADFAGSPGFKFANVGSSTMAVSITSPNITSANTASITVSAVTNLVGATSIEPGTQLYNNATNKSVLAFRLNTTGSNVSLNAVTFTSSIATAGYVNDFTLYSNNSDDFSTASPVAGPQSTLTFTGLNVPYSSTPTYFFLAVDVEAGFPTAFPTIEFSVANTGLTVSKGTVNVASTSGTMYDLIDNTAPFIQDISTLPAFLNGWGSTFYTSTPEYHSGQVSFIVTFNEPVQNVINNKFTTFTGNYSGSPTGDFPGISYGNVAPTPVDVNGNPSTSPSRYWKKTYNIFQGTGYIYQTFSNSSGGVTDIVGNQETTTGSFFGSGDYYYYLTLPKPTNDPVFQAPATTPTSVTLTWNHNHGIERATDYYIRAKETALAYTGASTPVNGTQPTDLNGITDGVLYFHIASNAYGAGPSQQSTIITGLKSGVSYDFEIYPYAQSDNTLFNAAIEYKLDAPDQVTVTTAIASASILETFSSTTSISTLIDENPVQSQGVFSFRIRDDADGTNDDNAPLKFSSITINQGTGNDIANWTHVIAGAALADGTANPDVPGTVGATSIAFTGLSSTSSGNFGYIDDNGNKTYTLKIWLRDSLLNNYASIIDGLNLAFAATLVNANYDDSNNRLTSRLGTTSTAQSGSTNNAVNVIASKLKFRSPAGSSVISTYPQNSIGVLTPFSSSAAQDPIVYALDEHNNLDLSYTSANGNTGSISNTGGLGQSTTSLNFTNGVLLLNPFYFTQAGVNTQIVVAGTGSPTVTNATSSNVTAVISNLTTISDATAPGSELASFPSTTNGLPASYNFDFTVTDDVGADATNFTNNDGLPTRIQTITISQGANNGTNTVPGPNNDAATFDDWTLSIAGAQITDGTSAVTILNPSANITGSGLTFNVVGTSMETVANNGAKTYQLRIWLLNPVDPTLRDILDNKDFAFSVNQSNLVLGAANTTSLVTNSSTSSDDGRNVVTVTATQLDFITQWTDLASQNYDAALSPNPTAKARDANQNLDTDYNTAASVSAFDPNLLDTKTYPLVNAAVAVNNGLITFNAGLQVSSAGNGLHNDVSRLMLTSGSLTNGNSNNFTLSYSGNSDIVRDGSFVHPTDIPFINNREAINLTAANSVALDRFLLRDGGASNDTDGTKTKLQSITLNLTNHQNIRRIGIYDETGTEIQERDSTAFTAGGNITFAAFTNPFEANDNDRTTKTLTVRVSFKAFVTDNQQINVSITAAAAGGVSSQLIPITIPGDNLSTDKNKIEVVATKIDFTTVPTGASISVPLSPTIIVSARDVYANLDLDYNGTISATNNIPASPTFSTINNPATTSPAGDFAGGTFTYPAGFQFDVGNGNVQLTISAGAGSGANNINAGTLAGTSPVISVISSFESWVTYPTGYSLPNTIPYVNHQSPDLSVTDDSFELVRYVVADGTGDGPGDGDTAGVPGDLDGASTVLTSFKIGLTNYTAIRSIGIYDENGNRINAAINIAAVSGILGEVTFDLTGNEIIALDDAQKLFSIRATFQSTPTLVSDTMHIRVSQRGAVVGTGSKLYDVPPGSGTYIAGNPPGNVTAPKTKNEIDVTATSLDFITAASPFAGINEPIGATYTTPPQPATSAAIVHARDKFGILDLGFHNIVPTSIAGASVGVSDTSDFNYGVLNLDGMQYTGAGDGTLTVIAGGIDSSNPVCGTCPNSIEGQTVDVINVAVTPSLTGVLTTSNIKGGTQGANIFGVTFTPQHSTTGQPSLSGFTFSFDFPYRTATTTIFKGFVVREGSTDVETLYPGATVTEVSSTNDTNFDLIVVDFGANKPDLFDPSTGSAVPLTYYLVVDVDLTANISTQNLTPQLIDGGYNTTTDNNIILTQGTATANVIGQTYQFASTRPPVLQTAKESRTLPFRGQLNVDASIDEITLEFDVQVWSLDGKAELFDTKNNTKIANLVATNGVYVNASTLPEDSIVYTINFLPGKSLKPDSVYYVTVAKGSFDNVTNTGKGISDNGFNFYGGTSFNGTLYFKISSTQPPILSAAAPYFSNLTSGVFSTTFDKTGTAYYMVLDHNTFVAQGNGVGNTPTIYDIEDPTTYMLNFPGSVITTDRYEITQISSPQYVSFAADLVAGRTYDVWVYANSDAEPDTIASPQPYGAGPGYAIGGAGPTVKIILPTLANIKQTKIPDYLLCPDSEALLTQPIVLSEQANNSFASASMQDFYLLLPTGFQFSGVEDEDLPIVQLNGGDFVQSSLDLEFINNTIVHIQYQNSTSTDLDNIVITNLKLIGTPGNSGDIKRFGGNAILPVLTNNKLASVTVTTNQPLPFTNSYSRNNDFTEFGFLPDPDLPPGERAIIKAIPDNYIDPLLGGSVRLIPIIAAANDYAPSEFLGNGVTNDVLNLGAVTLDAAFDITINHVNVNGCIVESSEQYVVYDHVSPISLDLGITQAGDHIGSKQSLVNPNFQTDPSLPPGYAPSPSPSADQINSGDIAGYKLLDLYARIPVSLDTPIVQIISGRYWREQVKKIPVVVNTIPDNTSPTTYKRDYKWDYTHIVNAVNDNPGITTDPYDNFKGTTINNNVYWTGGSLGKIEFTGRYQSTADLTLTVPFKQQVELFVPPIPIIEVSGQSAVLGDTAIFCRSQNSFTLNGWPDANAGLSTGYFELFDAVTNAPIHTVTSPNAGFTDNGNGVATLQPGILFNNYKTIRVEYTFNENNSPSKGTGYYYIKVTPNPVAKFSATSVLASAQPIDVGRPSATNAYCENNLIQFNNTSTFPVSGGGYVANTNPRWNIGVSSAIEQTTPSASFTYTTHGRYIVTFSVQSQYGCPSQVASDSIYVGAIPVATFSMTGISTATPIAVVDGSSVVDGPATNSSIASARWRYGSSTTFFSSATDTTYTIPGHYAITLLSTTQIVRTDQSSPPPVALPGCERTFTRPVIVVPALSAAQIGTASNDGFESNDVLVQWQTATSNNIASSWQRGDATEPSSIGLTGNVWATGLSTPYTLGEISFLYSPVYDLSELMRPKVSFDHVSYMGTNDGVVLEFSTDNLNVTDPAKQWFRIGTNADGNNWYDRTGLASKPGTQKNVADGIISGDYGWSSRIGTVLHSQHTLSPDIPTNSRSQVMFRFALSSFDGSDEGFAFDDFRIGERTRVVLIENFRNLGNTTSVNGLNVEKKESDFLKTTFPTVGTDIVKINYHVGFPNLDPFNDDFPADPSARALYYNISETPLARMDGGKSTDQQKKYFSDWGMEMYNLRTLKLADAEIEILLSPDPSANGGFKFDVKVTAAANDTLAIDTTILHIAFVEANPILSTTSDISLVKTGETNFEYVVKEMVPSALGTRLNVTLTNGQSKTFGPFEWNPDLGKLYGAAGDLAIVAFLQNEVTKEIYQAEILTGLTDPALVTDVEDPDYGSKVQLFPNPANHELNIQLPMAVNKSTRVEMYDTYGKSVYQGSFKAGEQIKTISTTELTSGVYLIQMNTPAGDIVRRKVMVIHR